MGEKLQHVKYKSRIWHKAVHRLKPHSADTIRRPHVDPMLLHRMNTGPTHCAGWDVGPTLTQKMALSRMIAVNHKGGGGGGAWGLY